MYWIISHMLPTLVRNFAILSLLCSRGIAYDLDEGLYTHCTCILKEGVLSFAQRFYFLKRRVI